MSIRIFSNVIQKNRWLSWLFIPSTASLTQYLAAGDQVITFTAPTGTLTTGASNLVAGSNVITFTAPTATLTEGLTSLAAGTNTVTFTAPIGTLTSVTNLIGGNQTVTFTAPTASAVPAKVNVVAGNQTVTFTAPPVGISNGSTPAGFWCALTGGTGYRGGVIREL